MRLELALERVQDAEEGAIALLYENDALFTQARLTMANIALLQEQLARARRGSVIGFAFGGVSLGVGAPLITAGLMQDNSAMIWSGAGIIVGTALIWGLGHYLFGLW